MPPCDHQLCKSSVRLRKYETELAAGKGEVAFAVAVADGCPTCRRGFTLVVLVLLPCLVSSRLRSHTWDP